MHSAAHSGLELITRLSEYDNHNNKPQRANVQDNRPTLYGKLIIFLQEKQEPGRSYIVFQIYMTMFVCICILALPKCHVSGYHD